MSDLVATVVGVAWVGALVLVRGRGPVATLAGLTALGWFAALLLPGALLWHRGPLVHLMLAGGAWLPRSWTSRAVSVVGYAAAVTVWPWVLPWTGAALAAAILAAAAIERRRHRAPTIRSGAWRAATVLAALSFAAPPMLTAVGLSRSWAFTVLVVYAATHVLVALLLVAAVRPWWAPWATDVAVELGAAPREQLVRALVTTSGDPRVVIEQARVAQAAADELYDRLSARQEQLAATVAETDQSRRRLEVVDSEERLALRRTLDDVAVVKLQDAVRNLTVITADDGDLGDLDDACGAGVTTEPIGRALHHLRLAIDEMNGLGQGLAPGALAAGLRPALARLAATTPVAVSLEVPDGSVVDRIPRGVAACVYFVAAEALANVVKHSEARAVLMSLRVDDATPGMVELVVADDGTGVLGAPGNGLAGLRDRAESVGGRVDIASRPGNGTQVRLTAPIGEGLRT